MNILIFIIIVGMTSLSGMTSNAAPDGMVFHGQVIKPDSAPLDAPAVQFTVRIASSGNESCTLLEETHVVDMTNSNGKFSLTLGHGIRSSSDPGLSFSQVFSNASTPKTGLTCAHGSSYAASASDSRRVYVSFNDGKDSINFDSPYVINSVPFAFEAERFAGKTANQFIQAVDTTSQSKFNRIISTDYPILDALLLGTSSLYVKANGSNFAPTASVSFNSQKITNLQDPSTSQDAATKNYVDTTIGSKAVDLTGIGAGVGDGKVLTWDATANSWVAGSPTVNASDATKLPLAGGTMSGAINMGGNNITSSGYITMGANKYLQLGTFDAAGETTLLNSISTSVTPVPLAYAGVAWYNTTTHEWRVWNGSAAESLVNASSANITGGSISGVDISANNLTVDTTTLVVDSSNNRVGIGTATPATSLDVAGALTQRGLSGGSIPAVSTAGQGVIYFDSSANKFKVSENGGAYADLVGSGGAGGSVTSVALSLPAELTVSGSPVTTSGTLSASWAAKSGNVVMASPANGSSGTPAFRALASADIPAAGGDVSGAYGALSVDKIKGTNVTITSLSSGEFLKYNGTAWVNSLISASDIGSGVLGVANGGTGLSSGTSGGIPYFSNSTTMASSGALTQYGIIYGGGAGSAPVATTAMTDGQILVGKNSSAPQVVTMGGDATISNTGSVSVNLSASTSKIFGSTQTGDALLLTNAGGTAVSVLAPPVGADYVLTASAGSAPSWTSLSGSSFAPYALLAGRSGGQSLAGGTAASENLTLDSTAHATKGKVLINPSGGSVGIGTTTPAETLEVNGNVKLGASISTHATIATGGVTNSATTIPVDSTAGYPDSGVIVVDNEAMSYTGKTATSFTGVTRGILGSVGGGQAHSAGKSVTAYWLRGPATGTNGSSRFFINSRGILSLGFPQYDTVPSSSNPNSNDSIMAGNNTGVAGGRSLAVGNGVSVGTTAFAVGSTVSANTNNSFAANNGTTATGTNSAAHGQNTTANAYDSFALGRYNVGAGTSGSWVATDSIFEIGIGADSSNKANALTVLKNGQVGIGTASPSAILDISSSKDAIALPKGNATTDRPASPVAGMLRFNTTSNILEVYTGSAWSSLTSTSGGASVTTNGSGGITLAASGTNQDVTLSPSGTGVVTSSSPVTFTNSTASTTSSSGALVVTGGVGVSGAINSGGDINSAGSVTAATSITSPYIYGSSSASANLTLDSTSSVVKGNVLIAPSGGNVGIGTSSPSATLSLGNGTSTDGGIMALGYGTVGTNGQSLSVSGTGARMFWYPKKAAFRAGGVDTSNPSDPTGTWWDDANIGNYSTAFGLGNRASGTSSFAAGQYSSASGLVAVALGYTASASGQASVALGTGANATSTSSMAIGKNSATYGENAIALSSSNTDYAIASGDYSVALGSGVQTGSALASGSGGNYSMGIGLGQPSGTRPRVTGTSSLGIFMGDQSGVDVSASNVMSVMGGSVGIGTTSPGESLEVTGNLRFGSGPSNPSSPAVLTGAGVTTTAAASSGSPLTVNVDSTTGYPSSGTFQIESELMSYSSKTSTSFNVISRTNAATHPAGAPVDVVLFNAQTNSTKSLFRLYASGSVAFGYSDIKVQSSGSPGTQVVIAAASTANGLGATVVGGGSNNADGAYSVVTGGQVNRASADYSVALGGLSTLASRFGEVAHSSGEFASQGDAQSSDFILRNATSDATPTNLLLDGSTASRILTLSNNTSLHCQIMVTGRQSSGTNVASFERRVLVSRGANAAATTLADSQTVGTDYNAAGWGGVSLSADTTNGGLSIQVTGAAATNIRWLALAKCAQLGY